jgi:hypothetical protein
VPVRILAFPLLLGLLACGDASAPKAGDSAGTDSDPDTDPGTGVDTPEVPDSVDVGGFTLSGRVMREWSTDGVGDLCVDLVDPLPLGTEGRDAVLEPVAAGTTDTDGSFRFEDVPMPTTAGYYVRAFACDGDDTQWFPTATVLLQDAMAGLGPNDELGGVSAWIATSDDVAAVAGAILEHSNVDSIVEVGVLWGQAFDTDGTLLFPAGIRGPNYSWVHYAQGDGTWIPFENTTEAGEARWAVAAAPFGLWTCRMQAHNVPAVLASGMPGWVTHWDYRATEDFSAR